MRFVKTSYQGTPLSHTHFVTFIMSVVIEEEDMNTRKQEAAPFGGLKKRGRCSQVKVPEYTKELGRLGPAV